MFFIRFFIRRYILYVLLIFSFSNANAQCTTPIATFPYVEDFETSAAWTTGGPACTPLNLVLNDWTWGHPQKTVITGAGSGYKCWIVGDTTGSYYDYGERSWVQSPCFDFTTLIRPYIQFKIFWESEYKYDGANFQYSLDNGSTWTDVGANTDPTDCMDTNWYNYNGIEGLGTYNNALPGHGIGNQTFQSLCTGTSTNGWCGNIQPSYHDTTGVSNSTCQGGHGLGQWVTAKHCMPYLSGKPSVQFRFAFGAGTACNDFNGFAFDSVAIGEGTPNSADFTTACINTNTIQFNGIVPLCPDTFQWNFGDPGSGASNTILGAGNLSPTHTFSGPGSYSVTLTVKGGPCNAPGSVTKTVNVISVSTVAIPAGCNSTTGSAQAIVTGNASPYTYSWSTVPAQTADSAIGLSRGSYTVTVTTPGACSASASVTVTQPTPLSHTVIVDSASCGNNNGEITVHESGGSPAYTFTWSPSGSDSSTSNLAAGSYSITITDSRGCRDSLTAVVGSSGGLQATANVISNISCFGQTNGSADVTVAGSLTVTYLWSTTATTDTVSGLAVGTYTVTVSNGGSCTAVKTVSITQPAPLSHTIDSIAASCGNNDGIVAINETGGTPAYTFTWNPTGSGDSSTGLSPGLYSVTVTDQNGCRDSLTTHVPSTGSLPVSIDSTNISCHDKNDGIAIAISHGQSPITYIWSDLATTDTISPLSAGVYSVTVTDALHCTGTASVSIINPDSLYAAPELISDTCSNGVGNISVSVSGGTSPYHYIWSPDSSSSNTLSSLVAGTYALTITDAHSCIVTGTYVIGDTCILDSLVFPSAFTPNGDNKNDIFGPVCTGPVTDFELHIYNRWGELIFESKDPTKGWDGTYKNAAQPIGTYTYFSTFTLSHKKSVQGSFMLFR